MPTGYTALIENGKISTAKEFIMVCAREFGAYAKWRDEPLSPSLPEKIEPDTEWHEKNLEKAKMEFDRIRSMSKADIEHEIEKRHEKAVDENNRYRERQEKLLLRYLPILEKVKKWKPPTLEHEKLKDFAINQIEISLPNTSIKVNSEIKETTEEWIKNQLNMCLKDIEREERYIQEEIEMCEKRHKWIAELRDSLENLD